MAHNEGTLGTIGQALTGFSEGVRGDFSQNQARRQEQQRSLSDERRRALLEDNRSSLQFVRAGDIGSAVELLQNRATDIDRLGGDPSDTLGQLNLLQSELQDPTGSGGFLEQFLLEGNVLDDRAVDSGFLPALAQPDTTKEDRLALDREKFEFNQDIKNRELGLKTEKQSFEIRELKAKGANNTKVKEAEQKQVNNLRNSLKTFEKDFSAVEAARNRILLSSTQNTGPADISLIFNFMKMNDPTSTVREGEFATAEQSGGVPDAVVNMYNRLISGERLTERQRSEFVNQANILMEAQTTSFDSNIANMLQGATQDGISGERVLGAERFAAFTARQNERNRTPVTTEAAPAPVPQPVSTAQQPEPLISSVGATDAQGFTIGGGQPNPELEGLSDEELLRMLEGGA